MPPVFRSVIVAAAIACAFPPQVAVAGESTVDKAIAEAVGREVPAAIPLRAKQVGAAPEQAIRNDQTGIELRNVVDPELIPVLPDPDKATGVAMIVAPGGGFRMLAIKHEGFDVARALAKRGIAAFILKYRTAPVPRDQEGYFRELAKLFDGSIDVDKALPVPSEALDDARAAIRLVRSRADEWGIDPKKIGMVGFSAGAITTLEVGLAGEPEELPDFIAPIYGRMGAREVPSGAPPMFLAIALDDPIFSKGKLLGLADSWREAGRPVEVHLYEKGGHGFGMNRSSAASDLWFGQMIAWMEDRGLFAEESAAEQVAAAAMKLGDLLDDPETRAVLERHVPELIASPQIAMARSLTLGMLQTYSPDMLTEVVMKAIDDDLAELPARE